MLKEMLFKNVETGKLKAIHCDSRISNLDAVRQYQEEHGKQSRLVASRQEPPKRVHGGF